MSIAAGRTENREETAARQREAAALLRQWLAEDTQAYDGQVTSALETEDCDEASRLRIRDEPGA